MRSHSIYLALATMLWANLSAAQPTHEFPTSAVKIVVPFAAGGPTDVVARILAEQLSARWAGKSVIIENRPGAGTIVATAVVAKAPPDGHTFLIATNSLLINPAINQSLPYDTHRDLVGVSMIATQPVALVANKSFGPNTIPEVVAAANAASLNYTSPGPRGVGHLAGELLQQKAGIKMTHINYNGSAPALTDVIAGRVPLMFDIWHSAKRYVDSGELKLIAGAGSERLADAPQVPTIAETYPGFDAVAFNAAVVPAGVPRTHSRQAVGRHQRRSELSGVQGKSTPPRHQSVRKHATGAGRLDAARDCALAGDRQGRQPQGGLRALSRELQTVHH
jgi:tripartite-type tricarboxylate transporter receptor subunit TctC